MKSDCTIMFRSRCVIGVLLMCFFCVSTAQEKPSTSYAYGVMDVFSKSDNYTKPVSICILYPSKFYSLPSADSQEIFNLQNDTGVDLCKNLTEDDFIVRQPNTLLLLRTSSNCSIQQNIQPIQDGNASGIIVMTNYTFPVNESYGWKFLGLIGLKNTKIIEYLADDMKVKLYGDNSRFDASLVVLWTAAVFCVAVGSYTAPYRLLNRKASRGGEHQALDASTSTESDDSNLVGLTVPVILAIVVFISTTLMLLYFFYAYLVYFFIVMFCIATAIAINLLTMQIVDSCCPGLNFTIWRNYGLAQFVVAILAICTGIVWFCFRHESWVWTLQDFMGICFCIHLIQVLQLPNMKVITLLLSLLFVYDVFFCFITPYMTKDGSSVMVSVATGGNSNSKESLPMLLICPRLQSNVMNVCNGLPSMLGFGDIIVPGFLVSFAHSFDLRIGVKYPVYLITSVIAYGIGLGGAFVALLFASTGQPALFYVVPMLLANIFIVGLCRKEVKALWRGSPELEVELLEHA